MGDPVEGLDQALSGSGRHRIRQGHGGFQHFGEVGPPKIGHAQNPVSGGRIRMNGEDRHDVRMLKFREDLRLVTLGPSKP